MGTIQVIAETIRNMLRALSDSERAEVIRLSLSSPTKDNERKAIDDALAAAGDNVTHAAEILGIARRTLMLRMRELGYPKRKGGGRRKSLA